MLNLNLERVALIGNGAVSRFYRLWFKGYIEVITVQIMHTDQTLDREID